MSGTNSTPVCLITGGSSGIGLATAKRFAEAGYHIAICGRRPEALEAANVQITTAGKVHEIRCFHQVVDLNHTDQAQQFGKQALQHFGNVDVLVNNAATAPLAPFEEITVETFESAINTNIRSVFYLTQLIWKHMKDRALNAPLGQGRGVVVNISSLAAVDPFPGFSLYGSCKAWLDLITFALASEGKELGLRVCSVRPGAVETPMLRGLFPEYPADQCVEPEEIAAAVWGCVNEPEQYPSGAAFAVTNQT